MAVAAVEGGHRWGAVGDNGTSYGPFQLHVGGALPAGRDAGWANSAAGIDYALQRIAAVARGKQGRAAVEAIVRGFERPADPSSEIQRALARYGDAPTTAGAASPAAPLPSPQFGPGALSALLPGILAQNRATVGLEPVDFGPLAATAGPRQTPATAPGGPSAGGSRKRSGKTVRYLEAFAAPYGLTVTSTTSGNHVKGSYHYRGRAIDLGGDPSRMAAAMAAALEHPQDFVEAFYTGPGNPGFYIKNGRVFPNSQLDRSVAAGHTDHVHIAR